MGWIIAILAIWILAPFAGVIFSFITWLVKWIMLFVYFIIDCFKR